MKNYINKIDATIPETQKKISILLDGKNLIITGGNGSGKTVFLRLLNRQINHYLAKTTTDQYSSLTFEMEQSKNELEKNSCNWREGGELLTQDIREEFYEKEIHQIKAHMDDLFKNESAIIDWIDYNNVIKDNEVFVSFFEANRQYSNKTLNQNKTIENFNNFDVKNINFQDTSIDFESYLVAFFEAGYLAYALRNDYEQKEKVDSWLKFIICDLRFLFEDESLNIEYREQEKLFYIHQHGKKPYTFSSLSSGYSSILKIYLSLLMTSEFKKVTSKKLSGIVIIDEIDAHLHVSLQKKILSFLDHAYPKVQFIVSTHSPFVIQSVNNSVIYDLSKLEQLEDLSLYSYESIIKGLLGVKTNSDNLNEIVDELASITPRIELHRARAKILMDKLSSSEGYLDSKAKVALLMAKQAIEDLGA